VRISAFYIHNNTYYYTDETLDSLFIKPPLTLMHDFSIDSVALTSYLTSDIMNLTVNVVKDSGKQFKKDFIVVKFRESTFTKHPFYNIKAFLNDNFLSTLTAEIHSNRSIEYLYFVCGEGCKGESQFQLTLANL